MADVEQVKAEVEHSQGESLLTKLADRVGAQTRVDAVFGEPVERDGLTVIPVARTVWGFGGGSGTQEDGQVGSGGGGGGAAAPLGHIEIRGGQAEFKPLRDPRQVAAAAAAGAAVLAFALGRLRRR